MKAVVALLCAGLIIGMGWWVNSCVAPRLLDSRLDRIQEEGLPKVLIEADRTVYCRMKADDFRFPLPPGARATNATVTGGFDTVKGSVEARFEGSTRWTAEQYEGWISGKVAEGGRVTAQAISGGILIKFEYFGDK